MGRGRRHPCGARAVQLAQCTALACCWLLALSTLTPVHAVSTYSLSNPANLLVQSSQDLLSAVLQRLQPFDITQQPSKPSNSWALLVAGSNGWENYRHQSDVLRAYHIVRRNGIPPENIITMVYDDIAHNESNPYQGLIFNEPGGPDVYQGVPIDYRGKSITARTFLDVLLGNRTAVKGKGSGKVVASGPDDNVFVFYSDHGSVGLLKFPHGPDLTAGSLLSALKQKFSRKEYKRIVFYLESCYSGSMFSGMHPHDWNVFAVTAATPDELSYASACRDDSSNSDPPPGIGWNSMIDTNAIHACLSDVFSSTWMTDSETTDVMKSSVGSQFERVRNSVQESTVMQYGDVDLGRQPISNVQGATVLPAMDSSIIANNGRRMLAPPTNNSSQASSSTADKPQSTSPHKGISVSQLDADLLGFRYIARSARDPSHRQEAEARYQRALSLRSQADKAAETAALLLLKTSGVSNKALGLARAHLPVENPEAWAKVQSEQQGGVNGGVELAGVNMGGDMIGVYASQLIYGMNGRQAESGKALVDNWDCFKTMIDVWNQQVSIWTNYARRHTRFFANLCNAGVTPQQFKQALKAGKR